MKLKLKRKFRSVKNQIETNNKLVDEIGSALAYLEPEACNEYILQRLVAMLTPMADTEILIKLDEFFKELSEKKHQEVINLYENFFDETPAPNNN